MFYCDPCAQNFRWPRSSARWNSVCEMCGDHADCSDIPSSALPDTSRDVQPPAAPLPVQKEKP